MNDSVRAGRQRFNGLLQWSLIVALGVGGVTVYKAKQNSSTPLMMESSKQSSMVQPVAPAIAQGVLQGNAIPSPLPPSSPVGRATPIPVPTSISNPGGAVSTLPSHTISTCNGIFSDANLRSTPTIQPWAVVGAITAGQQVQLTGRTVQADGETWHEVIATTPVSVSGAPVEPNQQGWIAGCFVRSGTP